MKIRRRSWTGTSEKISGAYLTWSPPCTVQVLVLDQEKFAIVGQFERVKSTVDDQVFKFSVSQTEQS